ncbi:MAG: hypothetical protein N2376_14860 [Clostridia bacterium]|nr:hypothetical protein [Clostridia bacterium]
MDPLKIAAVALVIIGAIINYGAGLIVKKMNLAQKMEVKEAGVFTPEELEKYKMTKAIARVKMVGLVALLPGVLLVFIAFR